MAYYVTAKELYETKLEGLQRQVKQRKDLVKVLEFIENSAWDYDGKIWNSRLLEDWSKRIREFIQESCPDLYRENKHRSMNLSVDNSGCLEFVLFLSLDTRILVLNEVLCLSKYEDGEYACRGFIFRRDKKTKELIFNGQTEGRVVDRGFYFSASVFGEILTERQYITKMKEQAEEFAKVLMNLKEVIKEFNLACRVVEDCSRGVTGEILRSIGVTDIHEIYYRFAASDFLEFLEKENKTTGE